MRLYMVAVNIPNTILYKFLYKERTGLTTRASYHISNCLMFTQFARISKFLLFALLHIYNFLIHNVSYFVLLDLTLLYKMRGISFPLDTSLTLLPCSDGKNSVVLRHLLRLQFSASLIICCQNRSPPKAVFAYSKLAMLFQDDCQPWDFF